MKFRTVVEPKHYDFTLSHQSNLMMIGSCFSENIGDKLLNTKFNVFVNPYGILFNPKSINNSLNAILDKKEYVSSDLIENNGLFHSFSHHGKFSGLSSTGVIDELNRNREKASLSLKEVDVLVITYGSAWIYKHLQSNQVVANCHKIPNKEFKKELLPIDVIVQETRETIHKLRVINPKVKVIFTISPVRHWKDGAEENNLSKSILNVAVHELQNLVKDVYYFPSYEMVIDDLRDYRYYKEDMLHPNSVAVDYVWNGFMESFFENKTKGLLQDIDKIVKSAQHKPLNRKAKEHQLFVENQINKIEFLRNQYPNLDFDKELLIFKNQLA